MSKHKWKLHTCFIKRCKGKAYYSIQLLPSIEIYYDEVQSMIQEDVVESPILTVQWLTWSFLIWFTREV